LRAAGKGSDRSTTGPTDRGLFVHSWEVDFQGFGESPRSIDLGEVGG